MRIDFHFHPSYHFLSFPFLLPPASLSLSLSHPFNVSSFFLLTLLLFGLLVPRPRNYPRLVESLISGRGETEARAIFGDIFRGPGCALPYDAVRHVARPGQRRTRRDAHNVTAGSLVVLPRQKGSFVRSFRRSIDVGFSMKLNSTRKEGANQPPTPLHSSIRLFSVHPSE